MYHLFILSCVPNTLLQKCYSYINLLWIACLTAAQPICCLIIHNIFAVYFSSISLNDLLFIIFAKPENIFKFISKKTVKSPFPYLLLVRLTMYTLWRLIVDANLIKVFTIFCVPTWSNLIVHIIYLCGTNIVSYP